MTKKLSVKKRVVKVRGDVKKVARPRRRRSRIVIAKQGSKGR